jgi:hypothetical protein
MVIAHKKSLGRRREGRVTNMMFDVPPDTLGLRSRLASCRLSSDQQRKSGEASAGEARGFGSVEGEMPSVSFYEAQAAMCAQMATDAKSAEMKTRWLAEANVWRQKAEGVNGLRVPSDAPLSPLEPNLKSQIIETTELIQPLHRERTTPGQPQVVDPQPAIDEAWIALLAKIRSR